MILIAKNIAHEDDTSIRVIYEGKTKLGSQNDLRFSISFPCQIGCIPNTILTFFIDRTNSLKPGQNLSNFLNMQLADIITFSETDEILKCLAVTICGKDLCMLDGTILESKHDLVNIGVLTNLKMLVENFFLNSLKQQKVVPLVLRNDHDIELYQLLCKKLHLPQILFYLSVILNIPIVKILQLASLPKLWIEFSNIYFKKEVKDCDEKNEANENYGGLYQCNCPNQLIRGRMFSLDFKAMYPTILNILTENDDDMIARCAKFIFKFRNSVDSKTSLGTTIKLLSNILYGLVARSTGPFSNLVLAAKITEYARNEMSSLYGILTKNSCVILLMQTDGIICKSENVDFLKNYQSKIKLEIRAELDILAVLNVNCWVAHTNTGEFIFTGIPPKTPNTNIDVMVGLHVEKLFYDFWQELINDGDVSVLLCRIDFSYSTFQDNKNWKNVYEHLKQIVLLFQETPHRNL